MSDSDRWLTLAEAMARLGLSKDSVRRRAESGAIVSRWTRPPHGGQRQYLESSVEAYRAAMETGAAGPASDA